MELQGVSEEVRASASTGTVLVDVQREPNLMIGIVGSALDDLPVARKRSAARDIAGRAYRRYPSPLSVDPAMLDRKRSELTAEEVIRAVRSRHPTLVRDPRTRVIALTAQDMYIKRRESWRFALSLRSNENTIAVVSYARMDPANLGTTPDEELLRSRLRKMIFKNIGIMCYGLPVSQDPRSVLYGNVLGVGDSDSMSEFFEPRQ